MDISWGGGSLLPWVNQAEIAGEQPGSKQGSSEVDYHFVGSFGLLSRNGKAIRGLLQSPHPHRGDGDGGGGHGLADAAVLHTGGAVLRGWHPEGEAEGRCIRNGGGEL